MNYLLNDVQSTELWVDYYQWRFKRRHHAPMPISHYVLNAKLLSSVTFLSTQLLPAFHFLTCNESVRIHSKADNICVKNKLAWMVFLKQRRSLRQHMVDPNTQMREFFAPTQRKEKIENEMNEMVFIVCRFFVIVIFSLLYFGFVWHCKRHSRHNNDHYYYIECDGMPPIRSHNSKSNVLKWRGAHACSKRWHFSLTN